MDNYGVCTYEDAAMLAKKLSEGSNILFSFSENKESAYVIFIAPTFERIGTMPFGGNPARSYAVSLLYTGMFYFDLEGTKLYPSYVSEKLGLPETDADCVTKMLNAIREALIGLDNTPTDRPETG